jgi:hypothetical protein
MEQTMSHFTVTALTKSGNQEELVQLLAPYEEELQVEQVTEGDETYWHNPNAKWDWWVVGGRWDARLLTTSGNMVNSAPKDLLAIEAMRAAALAEAEAEWARLDATLRGLPMAMTWAEAREAAVDINAARDTYWAQPRLQAIKSLETWGGGEMVEDYQAGRDLYLEREALVRPGFIGFGAVTPEGWIERGKMGWWGMSDDTTESSIVYGRTLNKLIDDLPGDAWITMIDCHI